MGSGAIGVRARRPVLMQSRGLKKTRVGFLRAILRKKRVTSCNRKGDANAPSGVVAASVAAAAATAAPAAAAGGTSVGTTEFLARSSSTKRAASPTAGFATWWWETLRRSFARTRPKHIGHPFAFVPLSASPAKCRTMQGKQKTCPHSVICGHSGSSSRQIGHCSGWSDTVSTDTTSAHSTILSASEGTARSCSTAESRTTKRKCACGGREARRGVGAVRCGVHDVSDCVVMCLL